MKDYWWIWIVTTIGGLVMYAIIKALVRAPGNSFQNRFARLTSNTNGVIKGKTLNEVIAACGQPSAISAIADGKKLYQWQATGYHVALIFDANNICEGVSSEIKV